jgi:hypothetical protein
VIEVRGTSHSGLVNTTNTRTGGTEGDALLLGRVHAGDPRAAMRLLDRHMGAVRRYYVNKARTAADVEALVAAVVRATIRPGAAYVDPERFPAHLFAVQQRSLRGYFGLRTGEATRCSAAELGAPAPTWRERTAADEPLLAALRTLPLPQQARIVELPIALAASRLLAARAALGTALRPLAAATIDERGRDIGERLRAGC